MNTVTTWLSSGEASISSIEKFCPGCARALDLRLARLLLQRLGGSLAMELLELIPQEERALVALPEIERLPPDLSLGFPDFISHAGHVLGVEQPEMPPEQHESCLRKIVSAFFSGVFQALPETVSYRVQAALPLELRSEARITRAA